MLPTVQAVTLMKIAKTVIFLQQNEENETQPNEMDLIEKEINQRSPSLSDRDDASHS